MNTSPQHNITALLDEAALRHPERSALVFGTKRLTFAALHAHVARCARQLREHGLQAGQRVIIMIPMSAELYVTLLGVIRCGAAAVFVDPWIPMRQIAVFAAFAEPAGFIGVPKSHLLRLLQPRLARLPLTVSTGPVIAPLPARLSLSKLLRTRDEIPPATVSPEAPALITFTSGSSGTPKGANRTHGFLKAQYDALCQELDYRDDDVDMPMFPVFALRNLAAGITSVVPSMDFGRVAAVNPQILSEQIRRDGVTVVTASPPFIDRLASLPQPPHLRKILTGGAPVTNEQLQRWEAAFPSSDIQILYGSTEAEPVARISSRERLATAEDQGYCCGVPSALLQTRLLRIRKGPVSAAELESVTCPPGEIGELAVSGAHVCRDYFKNPDAALENKIVTPDGTCWHRMGDTGYFDAKGRFFLTGRVHSTILRDGRILHAQLVESEAARRFPEARRVAALEQNGKLVLVIQGPAVPDALARFDADRIIFTRKTLPVDPRHNAKIDYARLRGELERGALAWTKKT
ncbi:MAG TPA: AMP-binding protein [Kiritimatiellia bacterium]|jgi:acyl-CoA synthetase (AMP-forming)/AMP-acid ligase II|nr:AMP-binding protein [Kiritimatiellia bacterium]